MATLTASIPPAPCARCLSASRHAVIDPNGLCANCRERSDMTKIEIRRVLSLWVVFHRTGICGSALGGVVDWSDDHAEAMAMADRHIGEHRR